MEPDWLRRASCLETLSDETLGKRLKRIEGRIRCIQKMIEQGRDCESTITQGGAVRCVTEGVGAFRLNNYMKFCFRVAAKRNWITSIHWRGLLLFGTERQVATRDKSALS